MAETAYNIEAHHVDMFLDEVQIRAQQLVSKLKDRVLVKPVQGRGAYFDQIGKTEAVEDNSRYPASPHQAIDHFRRKLAPNRIHWGHNIDPLDEAQMFTDKEGKYVIAAGGAIGRSYDTKIIQALGGNAIVEAPDQTTSNVALPSTQKVGILIGSTDTNNVSMNERKVRRAKKIFGDNDVDIMLPENKLYGVISPAAMEALLGQDRVVSSDFNNEKPLVDGQLAQWCGIEWIISSRLEFDGASTTDRKCYIYAKSGVGLGMFRDLYTESEKRGDLSFVKYLYLATIFDVVRLEEEKVVEIMIDESASPTTNP